MNPFPLGKGELVQFQISFTRFTVAIAQVVISNMCLICISTTMSLDSESSPIIRLFSFLDFFFPFLPYFLLTIHFTVLQTQLLLRLAFTSSDTASLLCYLNYPSASLHSSR